MLVVRRPRARRPKNRTGWLVGDVAMAGAVFQAGDAAFDGRFDKVAWWALGAIVMFVLALQVEAFKAQRGSRLAVLSQFLYSDPDPVVVRLKKMMIGIFVGGMLCSIAFLIW